MSESCKVNVWDGWYHRPCSNKAKRDGYCMVHHPESVEKRQKAAMKRYEEKKRRSPWARLERAEARVVELEGAIRRHRDTKYDEGSCVDVPDSVLYLVLEKKGAR